MKLSGKDFYRLLLISGILSLVLLSGSGSMEAKSGDNKKSKIIQWSQKEINIKGSLGDSYIMPLQFKSENYLSNVSLWVVPELQHFISVSPSNFLTISAGSNYMVNIKITIPYNSIPGYYEGTIHVRENSRTIPETLKVVIDTRPRIIDRVSANIPASTGGIITITESESIYSNGFELVIPPRALSQDTMITVGDVTNNTSQPPENMVPIGIPINIKPDGLTLNKSAVIRIPYSDEMLQYAGVSSLDNMTLKTFNTATGKWEDVPVKEIDTVNKYIAAEINHFSIWGLFSWFENLFFDKDPATDDKIIDYVVNDWNVINYIKTTWGVVVTADDIRQVLDVYDDPVSMIPYRSKIGGVLTAYDMGQKITAKDYAGAGKTGAKWLLHFVLEKAGYTWLAAYTGFASTFWEFSETYVHKIDEGAFNWQIGCYINLRKLGHTHEDIISEEYKEYYRPDGWLSLNCGKRVHWSPFAGRFKPEDVFIVGKAIWEARESNQYRTQDETNIKDSFVQALLDKKASSNPKADFSISPGNTGNPPFTVTLNASSSEGKDGHYIVKYEWDLGDGSLAEGVEVTKTYTTSKTYNVRLTVYDDANNSSSISKSVYVTLRDLTNQAPIADFTYQRNPSDPFTINFDASSSYDPDGNIMQYRWSFGDSSIAYVVSPSNTYAAEGNYTVQLAVTDDKLQSTTVIKTIAIDTTPPSVPTNLSATAVSSSQINLSWGDSTDDVGVTGYKVYRSGTYLKSVTTTSTSDTGLSASTQYCYTVSAYDAVGNESGQSSQVCATTTALPDLTGTWGGTWASAVGVNNGNLTVSLTQIGSSISGSVNISGSPCISSGNISGTVSGNNISFGVVSVSGTDTIAYNGTFTAATSITGTYSVTAGACVGDTGTFNVIDTTLVGYWKMDETSGTTVADSSGNNINGTATGTTIVSGRVGNARKFSNTPGSVAVDYISLGNSSTLNPSNAITIVAWINLTESPATWSYGNEPIVFRSDFWAGTQGYQLNVGSNLQVYGYDGQVSPSSFTGLQLNTWYQVVLTMENVGSNKTAKIYINGNLESTQTASGSLYTNNLTTYIGKFYSCCGSGIYHQGFVGLIDEVRIYNRALSSSEISTLYSSQP